VADGEQVGELFLLAGLQMALASSALACDLTRRLAELAGRGRRSASGRSGQAAFESLAAFLRGFLIAG
jgi:hypothetical protein